MLSMVKAAAPTLGVKTPTRFLQHQLPARTEETVQTMSLNSREWVKTLPWTQTMQPTGSSSWPSSTSNSSNNSKCLVDLNREVLKGLNRVVLVALKGRSNRKAREVPSNNPTPPRWVP